MLFAKCPGQNDRGSGMNVPQSRPAWVAVRAGAAAGPEAAVRALPGLRIEEPCHPWQLLQRLLGWISAGTASTEHSFDMHSDQSWPHLERVWSALLKAGFLFNDS